MRGIVAAAALAAGLAAAPTASGWGWQGHEATGAIAWSLLPDTSHAKAQVTPLLRGFTLAQAAVWADCAKSVKKTMANGAASYAYSPDQFTPSACAAFNSDDEQKRLVDFAVRNWSNCVYGSSPCHGAFHFADVAIQRDAYSDPADPKAKKEVGVSDHDVVHAIAACVAVLKGQPSPAPFKIQGASEALFLLAHYVGDLHQPLHVGAVYLSETGKVLDPDDPKAKGWQATSGGNSISLDGRKLHSAWDDVPPAFNGAGQAQMLDEARKLPASQGASAGWVRAWASDTILASHQAFQGLAFQGAGHDAWTYTAAPSYKTDREKLQATQVEKAGRRLAELLMDIWPG